MSKKVLYISPIWTNLNKYDLNSKIESGMPAFSEPLKLLLSMKVEVNILWIRTASSPNLIDKFLKSQAEIFISTKSKINILLSIPIIFLKTLKQIKKFEPDVVFCHGTLSVGGILAAKVLNKRIIVRIYGTNKYRDELLRLGNLFFMIRYPLVFLSFYISSDSLIATDDGSSSNEIFNNIGRAKSFYFLRNGYPAQSDILHERKPFILCVGRIEPKKNQIRAISFFKEAYKYNQDLRLKIIGETSSVSYFNELRDIINSCPFKDNIDLCGGIDKKKLFVLYQQSDAILGFQNNSNFGNVVIEAVSNGMLLFSYPEKIFSEINAKAKEEIIFTSKSEADLAIKYSKLKNANKAHIRNKSKKILESLIPSWHTRSKKEISIIFGSNSV